jgi:ribosomal protein L3
MVMKRWGIKELGDFKKSLHHFIASSFQETAAKVALWCEKTAGRMAFFKSVS